MALKFYDTEQADFREPTQADIDELEAYRAAYGRLHTRIAEDRALLLEEIRTIRARAAMPNAPVVDNPPVTGDI